VAGLFLTLSVASFIYCFWQNQAVHNSLIDTFPPELSDDLTAKFALHGIALRRSTPLQIQSRYVSSLVAGALFGFWLSLFVFSEGEVVGGWALFAMFIISAAAAFKSWRTYKKNCDWQASRDDKEHE
jgi:hypothetical protein